MSNEVMTRNSEWMNHIVNHLNRMVDNFERAVMNYRPMLGGERFMTDKELCARLQLSRRTLQDYRNNGVIPYIQLGGKILRWFAQVAGGSKPPRNVALWQVYAIAFSVKIQTSLVRIVCLPMTDCMMNSRKALLSMLSIRKATAMTSSRLYTS